MSIPILAPNSTWFRPSNTSITRSSITEINIVNSYIPTGSETASWDASAANDGSVMCYVNGTKLTIAGNGSGKIFANADSSFAFSDFNRTDYFKNVTAINNAELFDTTNATTFHRLFEICEKLTTVNVSNWNTENVTDMSRMFISAEKLTAVDVSNWKTGNVTSIANMFQLCLSLEELDVSKWDTSACENMRSTFTACLSLETLDLSNWDVSNVNTMAQMFLSTTSYGNMTITSIGDVSGWDTGNVENMQGMFQYCSSLEELDLSNWNVGKVTIMQSMFTGCSSLTSIGDTGSWNTSLCENMAGMFNGCTSLETLDLSGFDTSKVTTMQDMFANCSKLEEITLGEKFAWVGTNGYLPAQTDSNIPDADGFWYTQHREKYLPADIQSQTAMTYYASLTIVNNIDFLVKNGSLLNIADELRVLSGTENAMGLNTMATYVGEANNEIDAQTELIAQIANVLQGKANTSGMTTVDTCTVRIYHASSKNYFVGYTQYLDGTFIAASSQLESNVFTILTNVVCNSSICIITDPTYEPISNEEIGSYTFNEDATLRVFKAAGNKDEDTTIVFQYIYA